MLVNEIREKFLAFFAGKGHTIVQSSSLVPYNDPTLLFTNAGMNQFKDVFLGLEQREYVRATSAQKCVRAGGKHNDLDNVGYTARHHTFFEMLGNFSFGDYFKQDALTFAWEFLTTVLRIPTDKLYVTIYHTDDEAFDIWHKQIKLAKDRIIRIGDKACGSSDNFWQMGDTGPCGPCSEIFYDHGPEISGGLPGSKDENGDRYIEIWNCVFMQFNRDDKGELHKLPKPSVDTGMGLERIAAVMQHVHSNYDIDLFVHLIKHAAQISNCPDINHPSLKVLADHIRATAFLLADGVIPDNEGRGYVLRRIMRRAISHGYKLGIRKTFFADLVPPLVQEMGAAYPELVNTQHLIIKAITDEEERFLQTISNGMELLIQELAQVKNNTISGETAFKLYDTYGFPLDLTQDICREQNVTVNLSAFESAMAKQKSMARAHGKFKAVTQINYTGDSTNFLGYQEASTTAQIIALYQNNTPITELSAPNSNAVVVLNQSVCYAESGGQIGDTGIMQIDGGTSGLFTITDTQKIKTDVIGHTGTVISGKFKIGDTVTITIDLNRRLATTRNHSATHLLHKTLHEVLGKHAIQKGSLVTDQYTRFDFAHDTAVTSQQLREIERIVNHVIMSNYPVACHTMEYQEAIDRGAMALFGEKYGDKVRVVQMGAFSTELCGGTHVKRTGDIGLFAIINESGIASGIRRIEAITGTTAISYMQDNHSMITELQQTLKAQTPLIAYDKVNSLLAEKKQLTRQISTLTSQLAHSKAHAYITKPTTTLADGNKLLIFAISGDEKAIFGELTTALANLLNDTIIVILSDAESSIELAIGVSNKLSKLHSANSIVQQLAPVLNARGGGNVTFAKAKIIVQTQKQQSLSAIQQQIISELVKKV